MSTGALITMIITWTAILGMLVYLFGKLLRKEREKKIRMNESPKQNNPEKIFVAFGFLLGIIVLGVIAAILKAIGLF